MGIGVINNIAHRLHQGETNYTVPDTPGAFIHLSATSGSTSTLSKLLNNVTDVAPLSKLTTYLHTPDFPVFTHKDQKIYKDYEFYVFTTRDPFDRTISAFLYSMPENQLYVQFDWKSYNETLKNDPSIDPEKLQKNMRNAIRQELVQTKILFAYKCFATLQQFVDYIGDEPNDYKKDVSWGSVVNDCTQVARLAIRHEVDTMPHLFWDLGRLMENIRGVNEKKPILVIREEFLWRDWKGANRLLGHYGDVEQPFMHMHNSSTLSIQHQLTEDGKVKLCRAIEGDYHVYFNVLTRAANLGEDDLKESLHIARKNCPMLNLTMPAID